MMNLTRRALIGGVAASSLAPLLRPLPAGAAAPVTGKQAPGFYRYKVGSFECTSLNDGALTYPISADYVTNVSKDQVIAAAAADKVCSFWRQLLRKEGCDVPLIGLSELRAQQKTFC